MDKSRKYIQWDDVDQGELILIEIALPCSHKGSVLGKYGGLEPAHSREAWGTGEWSSMMLTLTEQSSR